MKKQLLLISLFVLIVQVSFAQTQRRVLVEEATNASCGPCAAQNPAFDALLQQNAEKVAVIKYHASWPGTDPMYSHNPVDNGYRITYYGISGVPTGVMEGTYVNSPSSFSQSLIDQYYNIPAPFELDMYHYLSPGEDSIFVVTRIRAAQDISEDNMRAYAVIVEKHISFTSPPGSNGEKNFYDVMKKILPQKSGVGIMEEWQDGEYQTFIYGWKLENVYDIDELSVIGFIQDNDDKDVKQSAISSSTPFAPIYANDAAALGISNLTETNCMGYASPEITIANFGSDPLTAVDIVYSVNGEAAVTYNWTGNLAGLQTQKVMLPQIDFAVLDENELVVTLENPNGSSDEYPANNSSSYMFDAAITTPNEVFLMIKTDDHPEDITWEVSSSAGEVVFEGGPYSESGVIINESMVYDVSDCYEFTIYDSQGDGIQAPGFFALYYGSGTQIVTGTAFGSEKRGQYAVDATVSVNELNSGKNRIELFPNPAGDQATISMQLVQDDEVEIAVLNSLGQHAAVLFKGKLARGVHEIPADLSQLNRGIYYLMITGEKTHVIQKIIRK
ncbi:MAG: T9SS type A sorting domain-containing protein [Bacteroidales bacterium]